MSSLGSSSTDYYPRKIFKLRKKNAQKHLTKDIALLGYILIVYQYIKFNTSSWIILFRLVLQTIIANPFPTDNQLMRVIQRVRSNNNPPTNNGSETGPPNITEPSIESNMNTTIPGGFNEEVNVSENSNPEEIDHEVIDFKKRLRSSLFHAIIVINVSILIYRIFNPLDFVDMFNGKGLNESGLTNTPSAFLNGGGINQGELRGGWTIQLIGERIPTNNFIANLQIWCLDLFVLLSQFTLLILTGINFTKLGYREPKEIRYGKSDGYDGLLVATQVNYVDALDEFLS
ncbi:golgi/endosome-localized DSC protein 1 [Monosporozyma servazzii]